MGTQLLSSRQNIVQTESRLSSTLRRSSYVAAAWAFAYATYRAYYAMGGTFGMHGVPVSDADFRFINAVGAAIIYVGAIAPLALLGAWHNATLRPIFWAACWIVSVGCVMHATVDIAQRVLSLSGVLVMSYPFWSSIDTRALDLQDLLFNEPWFLVEGLLWAVIAWTSGLYRSPHRMWWVGTGVAAIVALTVVGLLSATGVIGRFIVG
jgi:hypothetical protein